MEMTNAIKYSWKTNILSGNLPQILKLISELAGSVVLNCQTKTYFTVLGIFPGEVHKEYFKIFNTYYIFLSHTHTHYFWQLVFLSLKRQERDFLLAENKNKNFLP